MKVNTESDVIKQVVELGVCGSSWKKTKKRWSTHPDDDS
jgi:hypothetical protein